MDFLHIYATAIIHALAPEVSVEQSDENSFDYAEDLIRLNLRDDEDFGFMRHLREEHRGATLPDLSPMLWTILHEIGHYETADECEGEEYEEGLNTRLALACCSIEDLRTDKKLQDMYFNCAEEWFATEWAIDYVENHLEKCKRISKTLEVLK